MADLGSLAALLADIAAKVTTNGANENTGARVRASLENIADTLNGLTTVSTGNILWVDAVNGNDGTGTTGRLDLPFLTLNAAKTAATPGQTIVVMPGIYDEYDLVKQGVAYHFFSGAQVIYTGTPALGREAIWRTENSDVVTECIVTGDGHFEWAAGGGIGYVVYWQADNSFVRIHGQRVVSDGSDLFGADGCTGLDLVLSAEDGESTGDGFYSAIVGGRAVMEIRRITVAVSLIVSEPAAPECEFTVISEEASCAEIGNVSAGTNTLKIGKIEFSSADGLSHEGGVTKLVGTRVTATNAIGIPVTLAAAGMELHNVLLIAGASATKSIDAGSAQTITSYASYTNKAVDADVTVIGDLVITSIVEDAINNGITNRAPSQNAVFDALALKQALDAELTAIAGLASAANKAILFTGSGTATLIDLQLGVEAAYTGTITWTAGAAPSSTANLRQFFTQIGNCVNWQISLTYATTGTTVTNVVLTFPTEFPTPAIPTGFTGASVRIWNCYSTRLLSTPSGTLVNAGVYMIIRNAADTGFEIASTAAFASGSYRTFIFSGTYFTS